MSVYTLKTRYIDGWQRLPLLIRGNLLVFWLIFGFGIGFKIWVVDPLLSAVGGAICIMVFAIPLSLEIAMLLEFRGVELSSYQGQSSNRQRDEWLGKIFLRVFLILGNFTLVFVLLKMALTAQK